MQLKPLFCDRATAAALLSISESTFEALVAKREAPQPRMISGRRVGWLFRELEEWAEKRPMSDQLPPPNTGAKKPRKQVAA